MTLENRTAVITGATGGLGSVLCHDLAERGANLVLLDRESEKLASLVTSLSLPESRILSRRLDLLNSIRYKIRR